MNEITLPYSFMYEFQCNEGVIDEFIENIHNSKIEWTRTGSPNSSEMTSQLGYPVPLNDKLDAWLSECVDQVSSKYFRLGHLKICDMWMSRNTMGEFSYPHYHDLSFFSGLLYLQDSKTFTEFEIPNIFHEKYGELLRHTLNNKIEQKLFEVFPKKGKLIIWPSYIRHKISRHKEPNIRYTLAFNTFLDILSTDKTQKLCLEVKKI